MNLYITHYSCRLHDNGPGHPEIAERLSRIQDQLISSQLFEWIPQMESRAATDAELLLGHSSAHLEYLKSKLPTEGVVCIDDDTCLSPGSLIAARHAVGAVLDAVDAVESGKAQKVFCNVRPPGHHAEYDNAMGFCLFNNVAIGAAYAFDKYGYERIAILDFDVHHGNGTEDYARREPRLWFASSFEDKIYPNQSPQSDLSNMLKMPMPYGSDSEVFQSLWREQAFPALRKFKPQLILISAGFDGHALDPMANIRLHESDYFWITQEINAIAKEFAQNKVISVLEGGYDLEALGLSAREHIKVLFELHA
jgi:acetoin utilization deacetylase AcuC-like enzyme